MRTTFAICILVLAGTLTGPAAADPYKWCAVYGAGDDSAGTNCYFVTLQQCRATVSGIGGFCEPNQFYDGRPIVTPEAGRVPRSKRR